MITSYVALLLIPTICLALYCARDGLRRYPEAGLVAFIILVEMVFLYFATLPPVIQ